jgi:hypothetical protein
MLRNSNEEHIKITKYISRKFKLNSKHFAHILFVCKDDQTTDWHKKKCALNVAIKRRVSFTHEICLLPRCMQCFVNRENTEELTQEGVRTVGFMTFPNDRFRNLNLSLKFLTMVRTKED